MLNLLFNPQGRITAKPFWTGYFILLVVGLVLSVAAVYGPRSVALSLLFSALSIALIYPMVCVFVKRFHDAGKSGWWFLAIIGVSLLVNMIAGAVLMAPHASEWASLELGSPEWAEAQVNASKAIFLPSQVIGLVVGLAIAYVVSNLKSDPNENIYGPPPGDAGTAQQFD
ncbi:MAG: DUF805 domain-containing protein [Maricaulaceae bacterium]|jgi:uncharacterized membrane protein YhaH (DUF805 family)